LTFGNNRRVPVWRVDPDHAGLEPGLIFDDDKPCFQILMVDILAEDGEAQQDDDENPHCST
jgi:hypothetical protein